MKSPTFKMKLTNFEDDIDGIEDDLDLLEDDIYDDFGISDSFDPFINDPDFTTTNRRG